MFNKYNYKQLLEDIDIFLLKGSGVSKKYNTFHQGNGNQSEDVI